MADVKLLIAGSNNLNVAEKGDVIEVVPSTNDWGNATVTPDWIRLVVTNVPGTQEEAENLVRTLMQSWDQEFEYSEVGDAPLGQQRYRVQASAEIANDIDLGSKLQLRDAILDRFNGTLANQSPTHFEFDATPGLPLDEIAIVIKELGFRRYYFPEAMINQALASVNTGEPAEFSRTISWVNNNVIDRLKN